MVSGALVLDEDVRVPSDIFDLAGFRRWVHSDEFPDRGRFSFLAGEVNIDMSPEEIQSHNRLKNDLGYGLTDWTRQRDIGEMLADRALLVNEEANLSTEPDLMFCSWESLRSGRVRYVEWVEGSNRFVEVLGSPDLVVEIISQTSVRKDTVRLPPLYFAANVLEYWLIDARGIEMDFQILARGDSDWMAVVPDDKGYRRSDVLKGSFQLTRDRNPVGGSRYTLLGKSD
jgi:Uma2 family endonuclease